MNTDPTPRGRFVGIAVTRYDDESLARLDDAGKAMKELSRAIEDSGFEARLVKDPTARKLAKAFDPTPDAPTAVRVPLVLAWTGHGISIDNELALMLRDSKPNHSLKNAQGLKELARLAKDLGSRDTLIVIDTCHSGEGDAALVLQAISQQNTSTSAGVAPQLAVLVSSKAIGRAVAGAYLTSLAGLLQGGPAPDEAGDYDACWTATNERIPLGAISYVMARRKIGQQEPRAWNSGGSNISFRNPRFNPAAEPALVADALGHHDGLHDTTVRTPAMDAVEIRIQEDRPGFWLMLGREGSGKSTALQTVAAATGVLIIAARHGVSALRDSIRGLPAGAPVLIDGLDEAPARDLAATLDTVVATSSIRFVVLSSRPGALELVGPGPGGRGLIGAEQVVELDEQQWVGNALVNYTVERLRSAS